MIDWKKHFDHIYCIHFLPKHSSRFGRICDELKRVGILDSGIFSWKYTVDSPLYGYIQNFAPYRHSAVKEQKGMANTMLAHYEIYKEAECLNYRRIAVLEEDIVFLKDVKLLNELLSKEPKTDVVLFDKFVYNQFEYIRDVQTNRINDSYCFFNEHSTHYGSGAFYSVTSAAYKAFIQQQERCRYCPDEMWNYWQDNVECQQLTKSFAITNLGYQKSFDDAVHDNIELAYKFIRLNKSLYI